MSSRRLAILGTGIMGFQLARRAAEAGYQVAAWNRTLAKAEPLAEHNVKVQASPQEAVADADVIVVMVADGPSSDQLLTSSSQSDLGVLDHVKAGATILVMSSIPVETAQQQAVRSEEHGFDYLDAPVSGGEPGATDGTLAIMVGGKPEVFDKLSEVFAIFGRATLLGPAGTGSLAKLANQVIVGNTICAVAEALILVEKGGGDAAALVDALKGGFADSNILQNHGKRMASGDFKAGAPARIQHKDMASANALANELGLTLPIAQLVEQIYADMCTSGHEEADHNAAYLELRRRNNIGTGKT